MKILWDNKVFGSTITASSEDSNYTWNTALNDIRLSRIGKFTGGQSEYLVFDISDSAANGVLKNSATSSFAMIRLNSGLIFIAYADAVDGNKGKYKVLNPDYTVYFAEATFHDAGTADISVFSDYADLAIYIVYIDTADSNKPKIVNLNGPGLSQNWFEISTECDLSSKDAAYTAVTYHYDGSTLRILVLFTDNDDSNKCYYVIYNYGENTVYQADTLLIDKSIFHISAAFNTGGWDDNNLIFYNICVSYRDDSDNGYGKYIIYTDSLAIEKAETTFHEAQTKYTNTNYITDSKIIISYTDEDDYNQGKYIILNSDYSIFEEYIFKILETSYPCAVELEVDKYFIASVNETESDIIDYIVTPSSLVNSIAILNHNLTNSSIVSVEGWPENPIKYDLDSQTDKFSEVQYNIDDEKIVFQFAEAKDVKSILIQFHDLNPDSISVGYIFAGKALTMPGMEISQVIPYKSNSIIQKSCTGQLYGDRRIKYKAAQISFSGIEDSDRILINEFFDTCDIVQPFLLLIWEDDLDIEPAIYCHLTKELEWQRAQSSGLMWNLKLDFEEVF